MFLRKAILSVSLCVAGSAIAGEVDVIDVSATCNEQRVCQFSVTLKHADKGWSHYANRWQVQTLSGEVLAERVLHHPHVDEQPFTRDLAGIQIPADDKKVRIVGFDSVHESGGQVLEYTLPM